MNDPLIELKQKIFSLRTVMSSLRRFKDEPVSEILEYIILEYEAMVEDDDNSREQIIEATHIAKHLLDSLAGHHNDTQTRYLHREFEVLCESVGSMIPPMQATSVA